MAGVRTNFRMPDVFSIGIGGGSLVDADGLTVGPGSVGYELGSRALVFGGDTLTATDIAVAAGLADVGDRNAVAHLDRSLVSTALERISRRVADAVEQMRTTSDPLPVVAVGGGSVLLERELPGLGTVIRPERFDVANAIGAAIAQVSGEVDRVEAVRDGHRHVLADDARQEAIDRAVAAGARPESVQIVEFDEVPIPYLPGNATRIRVKAVGDVALHSGLVSTGPEGSR